MVRGCPRYAGDKGRMQLALHPSITSTQLLLDSPHLLPALHSLLHPTWNLVFTRQTPRRDILSGPASPEGGPHHLGPSSGCTTHWQWQGPGEGTWTLMFQCQKDVLRIIILMMLRIKHHENQEMETINHFAGGSSRQDLKPHPHPVATSGTPG